MRIENWIKDAAGRLASVGIESAMLDAQLIVASALRKTRSWVLAHADQEFDSGTASALLNRRLGGEPIAYITGSKEFYGRDFSVRAGVLIPRPETEHLIEMVLAWVKEREQVTHLLDVGTGSGCIAVTMKLELPSLEVHATDISEVALEVARENAKLHNSDIQFELADLWPRDAQRRYNVIVSNPPYVSTTDELDDHVRKFEPPTALFARESGLEFYIRFAQEAATKLSPGGALFVEIGAGQAADVGSLFESAGWRQVDLRKDLQGHIRVVGFAPSGPA